MIQEERPLNTSKISTFTKCITKLKNSSIYSWKIKTTERANVGHCTFIQTTFGRDHPIQSIADSMYS